MTRPTPYIGVAGVTTRAEAEAALAAFPACGWRFGLGVLVSEKTLSGQRNKWWRRYPPVERIAGIFIDDPRCLNLVHYSADTAPDADTLLRLFELAGPLCHGFQFNGAWPYRADLSRLHEAAARCGRALRVVLQLLPGWPTHNCGHYGHAITDVLLDGSGGRGRDVVIGHAAESLHELRERCASLGQRLGIGIAGGLCAETVPAVAPLLREGLSCDAEGRLRDDADGGGNLVLEKVAALLRAAGEAVSR